MTSSTQFVYHKRLIKVMGIFLYDHNLSLIIPLEETYKIWMRSAEAETRETYKIILCVFCILYDCKITYKMALAH